MVEATKKARILGDNGDEGNNKDDRNDNNLFTLTPTNNQLLQIERNNKSKIVQLKMWGPIELNSKQIQLNFMRFSNDKYVNKIRIKNEMNSYLT